MSKVTKFMTDYLLYVAIILMSMSVVSGISQYVRQQDWDTVMRILCRSTSTARIFMRESIKVKKFSS